MSASRQILTTSAAIFALQAPIALGCMRFTGPPKNIFWKYKKSLNNKFAVAQNVKCNEFYLLLDQRPLHQLQLW